MPEPSLEQRAIIDHVRLNKGNLIVNAVAGSGKTYALLEALKGIPQRSILICAFNRRIIDDISARLPKMPRTHVVIPKGFHALGREIVVKHFPGIEVDKDATEKLINRVPIKMSFRARWAAVKLLRALKEIVTPKEYAMRIVRESAEYFLEEFGHQHDVWGPKMTEGDHDDAIEATQRAYDLGRDMNRPIDFCDMIWAPLVLDLEPKSRFQAVLVDELQDISEPQWELIQRVMLPNSRLIGIGDHNQQIYDWRGSMGAKIWADITEHYSGTSLPLTITWRSGTTIVKAAQEIVPHIKAAPGADEGSVTTIAFEDLPNMIVGGPSEKIHTFVLSRTNRDLLDCAMKLWRERVAFELNAGKEMLAPMFDLIELIFHRSPGARGSVSLFLETVKHWYEAERLRAEKAKSTSYAQRIEEQGGMLVRAAKYVKRPDEIPGLLKQILQPGQSGVLLSTVHKVKGLEADRVFLLRQTFQRQSIIDQRQRMAKFHQPESLKRLIELDTKNIKQEELNLEYVAITRAREHLIWVDMAHDGETKLGEFTAVSVDPSKFSKEQIHEAIVWGEREAQRLAKSAPDEGDIIAIAVEDLRAELAKRG